MNYKVSETAMAARRQHELLNAEDKPSMRPVDGDHVCRVANAMRDYRREHINEPLARLWERLALVALQTD